jgi:hypothetical protein
MPRQKIKDQQDPNNFSPTPREASTFSQLTYLLHLVTALNSNDNLQSSLHEYRHGEGMAMAKDEGSSHSLNVTLLESVVAILVQQHEVVAACYTSDKASVVVAETDPNPSTDSDISVESLSPGPHQIYPLQLAAISNPDFTSNLKLDDNSLAHKLQIQTEGENLWIRVRDSYKWGWVLMRVVLYLFTSRREY